MTKHFCDVCKRELNYNVYWAISPTIIHLYCPKDGVNHYHRWSDLEVCGACRHAIHDAIDSTIKNLQPQSKNETA